MKHFVCKNCGNLAALIENRGPRISCCKKEMEEIVPNVAEASKEKHTPVFAVDGKKITVTVGEGDNAHPMLPTHAISWVLLITDKGFQRKILVPDGKSEAVFYIADDERLLKIFSYCNVHGLWVTEVKEEY